MSRKALWAAILAVAVTGVTITGVTIVYRSAKHTNPEPARLALKAIPVNGGRPRLRPGQMPSGIIIIRDGFLGVNLLKLGVALESYVAEHGRLPPAAIFSKDGKPLLSWRVALLPYLGRKDLYDLFRRDEPWDSAHNRALLDKMPRLYLPPRIHSGSMTGYCAFVGPDTVFATPQGTSIEEIKDGPANTVVIGVSAVTVPWTKPQELAYAPDQPLPEMEAPVLFGDGSVRFSHGQDERARRALITPNGGEPVDFEGLRPLPDSVALRTLNQESWFIVRRPGATPDRYRWALWLAKRACKIAADDGNVLNTLGVAEYRAGRYQEALKTLTHSDKLNSSAKGSLPEDLAFLAMTHQRLGQKEKARDDLHRLRAKVKEPGQAKNEDAHNFLREAEEVIGGKQISSLR